MDFSEHVFVFRNFQFFIKCIGLPQAVMSAADLHFKFNLLP